jgi:hypothetical protein
MEGNSPVETDTATDVNGVPHPSLSMEQQEQGGVESENQHAHKPLQLTRRHLWVAVAIALGACCLYATVKTAVAQSSDDSIIRIEGSVAIRRL